MSVASPLGEIILCLLIPSLWKGQKAWQLVEDRDSQRKPEGNLQFSFSLRHETIEVYWFAQIFFWQQPFPKMSFISLII